MQTSGHNSLKSYVTKPAEASDTDSTTAENLPFPRKSLSPRFSAAALAA
jgi:hypothetical protein